MKLVTIKVKLALKLVDKSDGTKEGEGEEAAGEEAETETEKEA